MIFTDEWGGGTSARCRATDRSNWGANAIFDIVDRKLVFRSYYKLPVTQTSQENCVAHNGTLVPVPGRDVMTPGLVPGRRLRVRLHRLRQPDGDRVLRPRAGQRGLARDGRDVVRVLVQRLRLRDGDRPRLRRLRADADGRALGERDRGRVRADSSRSSMRSCSRGSRGRRATRSCAPSATRSSGRAAVDAETLAQIDQFVDRAEKFSRTGHQTSAAQAQLHALANQLTGAAVRDAPLGAPRALGRVGPLEAEARAGEGDAGQGLLPRPAAAGGGRGAGRGAGRARGLRQSRVRGVRRPSPASSL